MNDNLNYAENELADAHREMAQALRACTCDVIRKRYDDFCPMGPARDNVERSEATLNNVRAKLAAAKALLESNGFSVR